MQFRAWFHLNINGTVILMVTVSLQRLQTMSSIHAFITLGSRKSTRWGLAADCNAETFVCSCLWEVGGRQRQEGSHVSVHANTQTECLQQE